MATIQIGIGHGGTGATSKAAAFNALSPLTAAGQLIVGGTAGAGTALAAGTDGQVLKTVSGNPAWAALLGSLADGDVTNGSLIYVDDSGNPLLITNPTTAVAMPNPILTWEFTETSGVGRPVWAASGT